jgi:hypothetical protein
MKQCDLCKMKNLAVYVDGVIIGSGRRDTNFTMHTTWCDMCLDCFTTFGIGLGKGKGQKYVYENDTYRKIEG